MADADPPPPAVPDDDAVPPQRWRPATVLVAGGRPAAEPDAPLNPPVTFASAFRAGGSLEYAREGSPSFEPLEEVLGALEGGRAVLFSSGMAAVNAVLDLLPVGGTVVAPRHAYTGVGVRLTELAATGRLRVRRVPVDDPAAVASSCAGADLLWLESPTNPMLEVADIAAAAGAAHASGALVLCDNTFATPLGQQPLALGADVVLHSATKYIGGHSDLLLGALVAADDDLAERLRVRRVLLGGAPGAMEAWLALRGVRTLDLRLRHASASAAELARRLSAHPAVARVRYPGLPDDPGHPVASRQMNGFGGVLSIETVGGPGVADAVCEGTRLWVHATSLGGVESLLERRRRWPGEAGTVPETLIRLSVGIEDLDDLWTDLDDALRAATT